MALNRDPSYEPYRHSGRNGPDDETLLAPGPEEKPFNTARQARVILPRSPPTSGIRTALRAFGLAIAASILGIQTYTIYTWLDTRHDTYHNSNTGLKTRSWAPVDSWPAYLMLAVSAFGTLVELLALTSLCSCFRGFHDGALHSISVYLSSISLVAAWIAGLVAFRVVYSQGGKQDHWDIWSWSCYRHHSTDETVNWKAMCIKQNYTFAASIVAIVVEFMCVVLFVFGQRSLKKTALYGKLGGGPK